PRGPVARWPLRRRNRNRRSWRDPFLELDDAKIQPSWRLADFWSLRLAFGRLADQGLVVIRGKFRGNPLFQFDDPKLAFPLSRLGCWGVLRTLRVAVRFHRDTSFQVMYGVRNRNIMRRRSPKHVRRTVLFGSFMHDGGARRERHAAR